VDISDTDPGALGRFRWELLSEQRRKSEGAFYTPSQVAAELAEASVRAHLPGSVCDPAVGGGVFLLATADAMVAAGVAPREAFEALHGVDVDPVSVEVARFCLGEWAFRHDLGWLDPGDRLVVGDSLLLDPWPFAQVDLVIGNPPFAGQLKSATVHVPQRASALKGRFGSAAQAYTDAAALFLLLASEIASTQVTLVLPRSLLAARDAGEVRRLVSQHFRVDELWLGSSEEFRASVQLCALRLTGTSGDADVAVHGGFGEPSVSVEPGEWSALSARASGVPRVDTESTAVLADIAYVTADFRDEYYALTDAVEEDVGQEFSARLVTSGLIDPAHLRWGEVPCRFGRRKWERPVLLRERVATKKRSWFDRRIQPKILVASQTSVIEAVADSDGGLVPSTPVVTVESERLWHVLAVLLSPVASAQLMAATAGSAQGADAMRVSASSLKLLSLPAEHPAWDDAADLVEAAQSADPARRRELLLASADAMLRAFQVSNPEELRSWWIGRLPRVR
jgi:N-6 DNA Methylase